MKLRNKLSGRFATFDIKNSRKSETISAKVVSESDRYVTLVGNSGKPMTVAKTSIRKVNGRRT